MMSIEKTTILTIPYQQYTLCGWEQGWELWIECLLLGVMDPFPKLTIPYQQFL